MSQWTRVHIRYIICKRSYTNAGITSYVLAASGEFLVMFAPGDLEELIVPRDAECDIRIRSPVVSREHCSVEPDDTVRLMLIVEGFNGLGK